MPTYHINIRTESHIAETLTIERDDHDALRIEMAQFVGQTLKDHAGQIWLDQEWQIDVSDARGLILYVLHISAFKAPAAGEPLKG
jgi:hypothetical protein